MVEAYESTMARHHPDGAMDPRRTLVRKQGLTRSILLLALLALVLAACGGGSSSDPSGQTWQLTDLEGTPPLEGTTIDMTIDGEEISGSSGCNTYTGTVTIDSGEGSMTLGPNLASTMMACEEPIMDQELRYHDALMRVTSFEMVDDTLVLRDESGTALVTFE